MGTVSEYAPSMLSAYVNSTVPNLAVAVGAFALSPNVQPVIESADVHSFAFSEIAHSFSSFLFYSA